MNPKETQNAIRLAMNDVGEHASGFAQAILGGLEAMLKAEYEKVALLRKLETQVASTVGKPVPDAKTLANALDKTLQNANTKNGAKNEQPDPTRTFRRK